MDKLVEYIHKDKGLEGIVANNYYQKIDASQTKDDVTLTIDGVILDETGMVISVALDFSDPPSPTVSCVIKTLAFTITGRKSHLV